MASSVPCGIHSSREVLCKSDVVQRTLGDVKLLPEVVFQNSVGVSVPGAKRSGLDVITYFQNLRMEVKFVQGFRIPPSVTFPL